MKYKFQDMPRFHQVCQLRRNTLDSTLDKHCLGLIFISRFLKSSWNNIQLNNAVWGEKKYLDHKQTRSNYPEVHMPCSKKKEAPQQITNINILQKHLAKFTIMNSKYSSNYFQPTTSFRTEILSILLCSLLSRHISSIFWLFFPPAIWLSN